MVWPNDYVEALVFCAVGACAGLILGTIYACAFNHKNVKQQVADLRTLLKYFLLGQGGILTVYFAIDWHKGVSFLAGCSVVFLVIGFRSFRGRP